MGGREYIDSGNDKTLHNKKGVLHFNDERIDALLIVENWT